MINRLIQFYQRAVEHDQPEVSEIWQTLTDRYHQPLVQALKSGNADMVEAVLVNLCNTDGIGGYEGAGTMKWDSEGFNQKRLLLAERMGILHVHNPEQPMAEELGDLNSKIESELGTKLHFPSVMGYTDEGLPHNFLNYCAALHTIQLLTNGMAPEHVLEIGAGIGVLGVLLHRAGTKSYTVIDLPHVAVVSAYVLSRVAGGDNVWLNHEPLNEYAFARFYPSTCFSNAGLTTYDVVFNSDSFPEIPQDLQLEYLELINNSLAQGGIFLSINHESTRGGQRRVLDAVNCATALSLKSRAPWFMRPGYVEEVYTL